MCVCEGENLTKVIYLGATERFGIWIKANALQNQLPPSLLCWPCLVADVETTDRRNTCAVIKGQLRKDIKIATVVQRGEEPMEGSNRFEFNVDIYLERDNDEDPLGFGDPSSIEQDTYVMVSEKMQSS
jgi:hypothetical protein